MLQLWLCGAAYLLSYQLEFTKISRLVCYSCGCVLQLLEDMLTMFDLMQLWQVDNNCVELEQIGLRLLLAFCANGVLDVSFYVNLSLSIVYCNLFFLLLNFM